MPLKRIKRFFLRIGRWIKKVFKSVFHRRDKEKKPIVVQAPRALITSPLQGDDGFLRPPTIIYSETFDTTPPNRKFKNGRKIKGGRTTPKKVLTVEDKIGATLTDEHIHKLVQQEMTKTPRLADETDKEWKVRIAYSTVLTHIQDSDETLSQEEKDYIEEAKNFPFYPGKTQHTSIQETHIKQNIRIRKGLEEGKIYVQLPNGQIRSEADVKKYNLK